MKQISKTLFLLAVAWSVIAGLFIFFFFGGGSATASSEGGAQPIISRISWFEMQGWWGVAILVIFAALFYGVFHFYQRGRIGWTVVFGTLTIVLTIISGFSIGTIYWPGSLAVLVGLLLLPFRRKPAK